MNKSISWKWLEIAISMAAVLVFFFHYSALHFPNLNSDHAIHVLMSKSFSFPEDLYFWGQDRLGSIIPMLGHVFYLLGISPLLATSMSQIILLVSAAYFFGTLVSNPFHRILILLSLLFPPIVFFEQVMVGHPYIGHFFFLGASLFIITSKKLGSSLKYFLLPLAIAGGFWSSELFLGNLPALLIFLNFGKLKISKRQGLYLLASLIIALSFLIIAKLYAHPVGAYHKLFASPLEIWDGFMTTFKLLYAHLTFTSEPLIGSVIPWLFIGSILLILLKRKRLIFSLTSLYFLLSIFIGLGLISLSKWSALMDYPVRYYVVIIYQYILFSLLLLDKNSKQKALKFLIYFSLISSSLFSIYYNSAAGVDKYKMTPSTAKFFAKFSNVGVLGTYWNSYIIEAYNNSEMISSPHEREVYRNQRALNSIYLKDSILLIANNYLQPLPDSLQEFGALLIRSSKVKIHDTYEYAFYEIADPLIHNLKVSQLGTSGRSSPSDSLVLTPETYNGSRYAVFGPKAVLPAGKYQVCFKMRASRLTNARASYIEVVYNSGEDIITTKELPNKLMGELCLEFELESATPAVEYRLNYFGAEEIIFYGIRLSSDSRKNFSGKP